MSDAETPPEPADPRCPKCGTEPTDESVTLKQLSDLGYAHHDVEYECAADGCSETFIYGMPVGEATEFADDLSCACGGWFLVHRVEPQSDGIRLHLKCPDCYQFKFSHRTGDDTGRALVGYPQITGELNPDKPYGFDPDALPHGAADDVESDAAPDCGNDVCIIHGHGTAGCPNAPHGVSDDQ